MKNEKDLSTETLAQLEDKPLAHAAGGSKPVYCYVCHSCGYELTHELSSFVTRCPLCDRPMKPKQAQSKDIPEGTIAARP